MSVDRSYVEQNDAERARLRVLVERLGEADYARPIGHGWTVGAALAHMAFWDWRALENMEQWEREGVKIAPWDGDVTNDRMLPEWLATAPTEAAREVLAAAEAADGKAATLAPDLVEQVMAQRPRSLIRAAHRREHLDEIEQALGRSS